MLDLPQVSKRFDSNLSLMEEDSSPVGLLIQLARHPLTDYFREHTMLYYCIFVKEKDHSQFDETLIINFPAILQSLDMPFIQFCHLVKLYDSLTYGRTRVQYDMGTCSFSYKGYTYPPMYLYYTCDEEIEIMFKFYLPQAVKIQDSFHEYQARIEQPEYI
ncbi:hypothetical protein M9H77_14231 [Catharanthus roseus]|uniref:Uncharacterized protein n=1 Tax=Catharanthus roseus TaxID=4058 RepID=A0ACC0BME9_CATRO|nr:hypothetical protein M9H77_14231 [Catharanthus roseus]